MKILLTGPAGQIGWELLRFLDALGEIIPADRAVMDLANPASIPQILRELKPDLIVNAAGYTAVDKAETETELAEAVNAIAPAILAREAAELGAAIVHYSTDYVFDGEKRSPYTPEDLTNPINVYGRTKLQGEQAIINSGAHHIILRTSWVYSMRRQNFLLTMLRLAKTRPELRVVNDQHGCPSWSRLIARGTAEILSRTTSREKNHTTFNGNDGIYHLACEGETTWYELAKHILKSAAADPMPEVTPIITADFPAAAQRPPYSTLDCSKARQIFGVNLGPWRPAIDAALRDDPPETLLATAPNQQGGAK